MAHLFFQPALHSFGTNWVSVIMTDSGGTNNGGVNTYSNAFRLGVIQTNHAPVVVATNFAVTENGGTNTPTVNVWDYDTDSSNLVLAATSLQTNLVSVSITGTNVASTTNATFTLAVAPVHNANGTATVQLVATEGPLSTTNTFTVTISAINQPPTYTFATNLLLVGEDSPVAFTNVGFLTNLAAGPANESNQTWFFTTITQTNAATNAQFTMLPTNGVHGTLFFQPALHSFGTNWVSVIMTDSGGTNNGGVNTYSNAFRLGIIQTNHAPVISVSNNFTVLENGSGVSPTVNVWDYDTDSSNLVLAATSVQTNLVSVSILATNIPSTTNAVFTLSATPVHGANGTATVQLVATEGPLSTTNTFTVTITSVNQPPTNTFATNLLLVGEDSPVAFTNVGFLTNLSAGPANESNQTWFFTTITQTNAATNAQFTMLPTNGVHGTLFFQPALHSFGTNWVSVIMTDSGGTNNGGVNTYSNAFRLGVIQTNHAPVIIATNLSVTENGGTNTPTVNVWDYDTDSSNLVLAATSLQTNLVSVSITGTNVASTTNATFTLAVAPVHNANGTATVQLVATEGPLSTTNTFTVTISPINQPPTYTFATNLLLVGEDSPAAFTNVGFLTNLAAGPANESNQTWFFTTITQTNAATNAQFTMLPTNGVHGTLFFQPALHSFGTNWVSVIMTDSGGTNNGGVNTYSNAFQLGVIQTNHAPVISVSNSFTVLENGSGVSPTVNVWDYDTDSSNLVLAATSLQTNLVSVSILATNVPSSTNAVFTLSATPVHGANGTATVQLVATEGPLSTTNTFTVTITPVNQPPTNTFATNLLLVGEDSPTVITNVGFLTNLAAGPANESNQTWFFATITQTNAATNAQFTLLPTNSVQGTLFFQPTLHSFGTNWVSVIMTDSAAPTMAASILTATPSSLALSRPITRPSLSPPILPSPRMAARIRRRSTFGITTRAQAIWFWRPLRCKPTWSPFRSPAPTSLRPPTPPSR